MLHIHIKSLVHKRVCKKPKTNKSLSHYCYALFYCSETVTVNVLYNVFYSLKHIYFVKLIVNT